MASLEEIRHSPDAVAVRVRPKLAICRPPMIFYSRLPCTSDVVDAVLFVKDIFQSKQQRLRALLGQRPGTAQQRLEWIKSVTALIEASLDATNIVDTWLLGDWAPVDIGNEAGNRQAIPTLNGNLWRNANAYTWALTNRAAAMRPIAYGSFKLPGSEFRHFDPWNGEFHTVDAAGYPIAASGYIYTSQTIRQFHAEADFTVPVDNSAAVAQNVRDVFAPIRGLRGLGDMGASAVPLGDVLWLSDAVRFALGSVLTTPFHGTALRTQMEQIVKQHFTSHPGAELVKVWKRDAQGQKIYGAMPGAQAIVDYYAAIARDIVETPYELFVLFGIENWANNLAVWAARGRINIAPERVVNLARDVTQARSRVMTGGGFAIAAGIAAAVNPIAGTVLTALGTLADLVLSTGGAVAYWNCPYPLTRRSAAGDCDFSTVIGPEALERAHRQQEGMLALFQARSQAGSATVQGGISNNALLIGAALLGALGVGYLLLKE